MEAINNQEMPHAIMVPLPLQGHVIPFVHLAIKLASKGFTITFINTESIHHRITKAAHHDQLPKTTQEDSYDIFKEARRCGLNIRYATVSDGFPLEFDRTMKNVDQIVESMFHNFAALVEDVVGKIVRTKPLVTCLIADTFFVWPSTIASKYNLVNVSFWTEPALVFTQYYHLDLLKINGHFACQDNREDIIDYIPGVDAIEPKDLASYLQDTNPTTPLHRTIEKAIFEDVKKADFIICNTVEELEPKTILALQQKQPFYPIGPIFALNGFSNANANAEVNVTTSLWSESDCMEFLQSKTNGSVLYVSFGSSAQSSEKEIREIAHGLLLSNVSFIWVLRPDLVSSDDVDFLPLGFEDNIKAKGLIVPWCNQISVISHPSIGGFLTHCGWNSVLESIWYNVPMLCYPLFTDQLTNRKLVVDDWKIGLNLCDTQSITREEAAEKINTLMRQKLGNDLRKNIKQVQDTLEHAGSNGSSHKNFDQFIADVKVKISKMSR